MGSNLSYKIYVSFKHNNLLQKNMQIIWTSGSYTDRENERDKLIIWHLSSRCVYLIHTGYMFQTQKFITQNMHILCNDLCLTETYILYELDKHIRTTTVKRCRWDIPVALIRLQVSLNCNHNFQSYCKSYCSTVHCRRISSIYQQTNAHIISHKTHFQKLL